MFFFVFFRLFSVRSLCLSPSSSLGDSSRLQTNLLDVRNDLTIADLGVDFTTETDYRLLITEWPPSPSESDELVRKIFSALKSFHFFIFHEFFFQISSLFSLETLIYASKSWSIVQNYRRKDLKKKAMTIRKNFTRRNKFKSEKILWLLDFFVEKP